MRLWHQSLIPLLPRQQLLGQHRECAALRGLGWGKKHSTVDYVFTHPIEWLIAYHHIVMAQMYSRFYSVSDEWINPQYRGKRVGISPSINEFLVYKLYNQGLYGKKTIIYPEHNDTYLLECIENLKNKGIKLNT